MFVDCNLDSPAFQIRNAIHKIVKVDPGRHLIRQETIVTRRNTQKENLLSGDLDQFSQEVRKQLWQTGAASENKFVSDHPAVRSCFNKLQSRRAILRRPDCSL